MWHNKWNGCSSDSESSTGSCSHDNKKNTRLSPLFHTASDEKLGGAWEWGYGPATWTTWIENFSRNTEGENTKGHITADLGVANHYTQTKWSSLAGQMFAGKKEHLVIIDKFFVAVARMMVALSDWRAINNWIYLQYWSHGLRRRTIAYLQPRCPWQLQGNDTNNKQVFLAITVIVLW